MGQVQAAGHQGTISMPPILPFLTLAPGDSTEMILGLASGYACLGDLDKWAASRLQVACK